MLKEQFYFFQNNKLYKLEYKSLLLNKLVSNHNRRLPNLVSFMLSLTTFFSVKVERDESCAESVFMNKILTAKIEVKKTA